ncbi:restriction endonuclease subunit S [Staphylococcus aureus]|uniref:Sau1hsdS1 n=4 Tax=Staphylococcus aureus TaxID=1280 RepID=B0FFT9_STAAU|nr:restriction endonuclease subunit S [Staphylococcus aureus]ABY60973.1 Sau1hsdS1 [Staphylococcus aureus]MBW5880452.1 restriction endonuclease subunit S [Staphylococcus aureus]MBW5882728.1 restriction endonuclease subunit S [Staphylococcus aureus]MCQ1427713.1 restriction endonuclease subunit S [Staphylococcus aureus]NDP98177.1 restriction endonuclease subunit S [Staphylococcus aureus]
MSNTQKKNVPELRFPGFEGEWEEKSISSFLKESKIKGSNGSHAKKLTVKLWGKGVVPKKETFKGSDNTQYYKRKAGQLMYGKLDFLNCAFGIVPDSLNNYESTIDSPSFDFINGDSKFLLERIKLKSFYKKFGDIANGSRKAKRINQDTFLSLPVFAPKYDEQLRIGEFFSKLDRQIELQKQKLELLQQQKKGYMQKIFSQELRFKDENGEDYPHWENSKIEKYLKERNERSDKGQMLSVTINSGIIKFSELDRKDNSSKNKSNYKVVRKNDIAYNSMRMWQGASGKSNYNGIVSPAYTVLYPTQNTSSLFIGYKFKTHRMIHKFKINSQGLTSDTWNLKYKQLKNINIDIPVLEEQEKIGDFFKKMDILISKQKIKIEILEKEKQSFLQKMFL